MKRVMEWEGRTRPDWIPVLLTTRNRDPIFGYETGDLLIKQIDCDRLPNGSWHLEISIATAKETPMAAFCAETDWSEIAWSIEVIGPDEPVIVGDT